MYEEMREMKFEQSFVTFSFRMGPKILVWVKVCQAWQNLFFY